MRVSRGSLLLVLVTLMYVLLVPAMGSHWPIVLLVAGIILIILMLINISVAWATRPDPPGSTYVLYPCSGCGENEAHHIYYVTRLTQRNERPRGWMPVELVTARMPPNSEIEYRREKMTCPDCKKRLART